jgi:thiamine-monophosphate kinase
MKLSTLGERKIIELFAKHFDKRVCSNVALAIGDDCAVLKLGDDRCLLVSTDTVLEATHIPKEMTPEQIGKYAVNVVLSDIAAMGGSPLGLVFSITLPPDLDEEFIHKLGYGLESAAKEHNTCIVGGDTQKAEEIAITGTGLGTVSEKKVLLRSGAKVGDSICVTGNIGSAAAGFYCLTRDLACPERFIKKALEPKARLEAGGTIAGLASSCIDISDGLALSIHEITSQSKVGSLIYEDGIPIDKGLMGVEKMSGVSAREMVFYKGGDFELLFTIDKENYKEVEEQLKKLSTKVAKIGEITVKGNKVIDKAGETRELEMRGWDAFKEDIFLTP